MSGSLGRGTGIEVIERLSSVLGRERVLASQECLEPYLRSTICQQRTLIAVAKVEDTSEVQKVLWLASQFDFAVYPISTGKNWGYGSALAVNVEPCVILDLSGMNRIIEVNSELAYAVLEPGVSQHQLFQYLSENNIPLSLDPTGAGPFCSIAGNALERGYGLGAYHDHFDAVSGMEIVLANGEILKTGFGHFQNARARYLFKWGLGPYLDGIFTQSNFGVLTKLSVCLHPKPERTEACYFQVNRAENFNELVEAIRRLLLADVFSGSVNLVARNRVLTMHEQYPWQEMAGSVPMSEEVAQKLARRLGAGLWNGLGAFYGSRKQVKAAKEIVRQEIGHLCSRMIFVSEAKIGRLKRIGQFFKPVLPSAISKQLTLLEQSFGIIQGKPSEISLGLPYWRNRKMSVPERDIDPARDGCGLFWFTPVIPMTAKDMQDFLDLAQPILEAHGFDFCPTFTAVNARSFDCSLPILFDADREAEKAQDCYQVLSDYCKAEGFLPYRLGVHAMSDLTSEGDTYWKTVSALKATLDPKNIISPGRYCP